MFVRALFFAIFLSCAAAFAARPPFDGVSYVQRGILKTGDSCEAVTAMVSVGNRGELALHLECRNITMAKIVLAKDGSEIILQGGAMFCESDVREYVLAVFNALFLRSGWYDGISTDANGRIVKISAKNFTIFLENYGGDKKNPSLPRRMRVLAEDFVLILNLAEAKK